MKTVTVQVIPTQVIQMKVWRKYAKLVTKQHFGDLWWVWHLVQNIPVCEGGLKYTVMPQLLIDRQEHQQIFLLLKTWLWCPHSTYLPDLVFNDFLFMRLKSLSWESYSQMSLKFRGNRNPAHDS